MLFGRAGGGVREQFHKFLNFKLQQFASSESSHKRNPDREKDECSVQCVVRVVRVVRVVGVVGEVGEVGVVGGGGWWWWWFRLTLSKTCLSRPHCAHASNNASRDKPRKHPAQHSAVTVLGGNNVGMCMGFPRPLQCYVFGHHKVQYQRCSLVFCLLPGMFSLVLLPCPVLSL